MTQAEICKSAGTARKISIALKGRMRPESAIAKMIATKKGRTAAEGHWYKSKRRTSAEGHQLEPQKAPVPRITELQTSPLAFTSTDAAFAEMMELRFKISGWNRAFQAKHGREPDEGELAKGSPDMQKIFARYAAVLQFLRQEE